MCVALRVTIRSGGPGSLSAYRRMGEKTIEFHRSDEVWQTTTMDFIPGGTSDFFMSEVRSEFRANS